MTFEQRIRSGMQAAADSTPSDSPAGAEAVSRKGQRRRKTKIVGVASLVAILATSSVAFALMSGNQDVVTPPPTDEPSPSGCPVTRPAGKFTPPTAWPDRPAPEAIGETSSWYWYGTDELWTYLAEDGLIEPRRHRSFWSIEFAGGGEEPSPKIEVIWRDLNSDRPPISNGGVGGYGSIRQHHSFMMVGNDPGIASCWEVTATYKDETLTFVYESVEVPSCPVTIPSGEFSPPAPWTAQPATAGHLWYGTDDLWTVIPEDGNRGGWKSVFWSVHFPGGDLDGGFEYEPEIHITWNNLWSDDPPISNEGKGTNATTPEDHWFMIGGLDPDDPGCWEVTATYKGATLSFVYLVPEP